MNRNIEFHPTLIIGLGGTGHGILLKLKKRFIDQFGEVPPIIQFLAIDTTQEAERQDTSADGKTGVELRPNDEHYIVRVEDAANLLRGKNPHISEWWPKGARVATIKSGAQQLRALGRLALFSAQKEIKRRITQKLDEIRKIENMNSMQDKGFTVSTGNGVDVYVVTSLAGGTGSGMFLDVAFITRNIVPSSNITGAFVLSRVFGQFSGTDLVRTNTYSALKEIEYLSKLRDNEVFEVSYGINKVPVNQPPYDMIYILDSINEADKVIEKDKTLHTQIADGIYLLVGSEIGAGSSNAMDNIQSHNATAGLVENRYSGYCSFGVSSCTWKVNEFKTKLLNAKDASARKLVEDLIGSAMRKEDVKADVLALTQKCNIKENRIQDFLDEIGTSKGNRLESFVEKAQSFPRANLNSYLRAGHAQHLQDVERQAKANANINYERLKTEFLNEFDSRQKESLSRADFLFYLSNFTQELAQVINNALDAVQDKLKKAERDFNEYKFEELGQASGSGSSRFFNKVTTFFKSFFAGPVVESNRDSSYAADVDRQSRAKVTILYCDKALLLLRELKNEVEKVEADCKQFRLRLSDLHDQLQTQEIRRVEEEPEEENPFIKVLPICPPVKQRAVKLSQFRDWCKEKHLPMSELISASGTKIAEIINEFMGSEYKDDFNMTINQVLKIKENEEELTQNQVLLSYLSRQAAPLWRYRGTEIPQTQYRVENVAYCGVPDSKASPVKSLKSGWLGKEPQLISTIDPQRITFFNITFGVPLFALADLKELKEEYAANKRPTCHLQRRWQDLPDLFPPQIDNLVCFAVAQAPDFRLIRKNGKGAYAIYIDQQKGKPLARGLEESFNRFQDQIDNVEEVMRAIAQKLNNQDRQATMNILDAQKKRLTDLIARNGLNDSSIDFVKRQVKAIESYLKDF